MSSMDILTDKIIEDRKVISDWFLQNINILLNGFLFRYVCFVVKKKVSECVWDRRMYRQSEL